MEFIVFDLEATCWDDNLMGREQEIIEIGALRINPYGEVTGQFQTFVKPLYQPRLSVYCKELTGITQSDVDAAEHFASAGHRFREWINDEAPVLCSWGARDLELLQSDCAVHKLPNAWLDGYFDLKDQYHDFKGLSKKRGLKRVLLSEGFEFEGNHHRALDDAMNLSHLFTRYIDSWMY